MNVKTIVINLDRRTDRYQEFLSNYTYGEHERFSGVDGKQIINSDILTDWEKKFKQKLKNHPGVHDRHLPGVFGCWMSHYNVWLKLSTDKTSDVYLIFEDDMRPVKNFNSRLSSVLSSIDETFDIYYIGGRFKENFTPTNLGEWEEIKIGHSIFYKSKNPERCGGNYDRGLFAYILTKNGAKNLLMKVNEYMDSKPAIGAVDEWVNKDVDIRRRVVDVFPHLSWSPRAYKSDIR